MQLDDGAAALPWCGVVCVKWRLDGRTVPKSTSLSGRASHAEVFLLSLPIGIDPQRTQARQGSVAWCMALRMHEMRAFC